jgi:hypothetical protein
MTEKRRWPDTGSIIENTRDCFRCGFEFSPDPATREEEIGHQAINGSLCYSCAINSVTAYPSRFSVRAAHDFQVIRFENTVWDTTEHQPVSTPRAIEALTETEWAVVEAIATRSLEDRFATIDRSSLAEEKVKAATVFESPMESADGLLSLPRLTIIGMDTVFTKRGNVEQVKQRLSDPRAEAEQVGLAQY